MRLFNERALPDLDGNIKNGNSLVGPDFYQQLALTAIGDELRARVNPFDWAAEFPGIITKPSKGFDAVIGNPPYIRMEAFKELKAYLRATFAVHDERSDMYAYFVEQGHRLLRKGGRFGMILSNKFLRARYGAPLRQFLARNALIRGVVDFAGLPVFVGATVRTVVLLTEKDEHQPHAFHYAPPMAADSFSGVRAGRLSIEGETVKTRILVSSETLGASGWSFTDKRSDDLLRKLREIGQPLADYSGAQVMRGVVSGLTEAFVVDDLTRKALIADDPASAEIIRPFLQGRSVKRYRIEWDDHYLIYTPKGTDVRRYPAVERHLRGFKSRLEGRATKQAWYELQQAQARYEPTMAGPKIIFPDIATAPRFALDTHGFFGANTTYFLASTDLYLLAVLNSRLAYFYFRLVCAGLERGGETYLRFFGQYMEVFPVAPATRAENARARQRIERLVQRMLELQGRGKAVGGPAGVNRFKREIAGLDAEIDALVFELYGLSRSEVDLITAQTTDPEAAP